MEDIPPIALRLLPGAEDILEITLVNQGQPSNVFVEASGSIKKAVRLKKASYFVVQEELVPILVKMPRGASRLSGEILVDSDESISRIPLTLVSDSDADEGEESSQDDDYQDRPDDEDLDEEYSEDEGSEDSEDEESFGRGRSYEDDEDDDSSPGTSEPRYRITRVSQPVLKPRSPPIPAPKPSYRVRRAGPTSYADVYYGDRSDGDSGSDLDLADSSHLEPEQHEPSPARSRRRGGPYQGSRAYGSSSYSQSPQDSSTYEQSSYDQPGDEQSSYDQPEYEQSSYEQSSYGQSGYEHPDDAVSEEDLSSDEESGGLGLPLVPLAMMVMLVTALVLTFLLGVIPEFPGALTSSILIVTLIIYGAATLLKA